MRHYSTACNIGAFVESQGGMSGVVPNGLIQGSLKNLRACKIGEIRIVNLRLNLVLALFFMSVNHTVSGFANSHLNAGMARTLTFPSLNSFS